jgi:hypothetical protein
MRFKVFSDCLAFSPFEVRPIAHLNDLDAFLFDLQAKMDENDHGTPSFVIGDPGAYEKLGMLELKRCCLLLLLVVVVFCCCCLLLFL